MNNLKWEKGVFTTTGCMSERTNGGVETRRAHDEAPEGGQDGVPGPGLGLHSELVFLLMSIACNRLLYMYNVYSNIVLVYTNHGPLIQSANKVFRPVIV